MSHITRRKFIGGSVAVVGTVALAPVAWTLPVPVELPPFTNFETYQAFAEALTVPFMAEIREASIMRKILAERKLERAR